MATEHETMIEPAVEGLLERADSKFRLVTLGAARARQINAYFGQLGDGLVQWDIAVDRPARTQGAATVQQYHERQQS